MKAWGRVFCSRRILWRHRSSFLNCYSDSVIGSAPEPRNAPTWLFADFLPWIPSAVVLVSQDRLHIDVVSLDSRKGKQSVDWKEMDGIDMIQNLHYQFIVKPEK